MEAKFRFAAIYIPACAVVGAMLRLSGAPEGPTLAVVIGLFMVAFLLKVVAPEERR